MTSEIVVSAILFLVAAIALCAIVGKTGHGHLLGLLMFVPVANLVFLIYLAFSRWPIERELGELRIERDRLSAEVAQKTSNLVQPTRASACG